MTPEALAALQARAYRDMAPWTARDFADLLAQPVTILCTRDHAFCLLRSVADEAEILSLATDPAHQRRGLASAVLQDALTAAGQRGAATVFLEVAARNAPALAFYAAKGFRRRGLRKGYYPQPQGPATDALVMSRALTLG